MDVEGNAQRESSGGDIVLRAAVAEDTHVQAFIERAGMVAEPFETVLRGVETPMALVRLQGACRIGGALEQRGGSG